MLRADIRALAALTLVAGVTGVACSACSACSGAYEGRADTRTYTPPATPPLAENLGHREPEPDLSEPQGPQGPVKPQGPVASAEPPPRSPPTAAIELTFVGDIIFGRYRDDGYDPIPGDDDQPFAEIKDLLASDLAIGNLETPMIRDLPETSPIGSTFRFGADASQAQHLVDAGLTALSLANNHAFDLRAEGMRQTPEILGEHDLIALGAAREEEPLFRVETIDRIGWRIGLLAVTSRRNAPDFEGAPRLPFLAARDLEETLGPLIDEARVDHDAVIIFIHWGDEYADAPASYQQRYARRLIDRGATAMIGHHPHVLQGIERYKHGVIAYSLGNFLFENTNEIPRQTGILRLRLEPSDGCIAGVRFHPAYIKRYPSPHPVPATGGMGKVVRRRVQSLSKELGKTVLEVDGEDLTVGGFDCPAVPVIPEVAEEPEATDTPQDPSPPT